MCDIKVEFAYQWEPFLKDWEKEYFFPEKITLFMKKTYNHPAIYRWNIFRNKPDDEKLIYIGEAQKLCPQRISGYLNPGPSQQTNQRINKKFHDLLNNGFKIRLEILCFDNIKIKNFTITNSHLNDRHVRRFVEELMIVIYKLKGFTILNL